MTTGKLVAWGPEARNAAISRVSSCHRSSQTIFTAGLKTRPTYGGWSALHFKEQPHLAAPNW